MNTYISDVITPNKEYHKVSIAFSENEIDSSWKEVNILISCAKGNPDAIEKTLIELPITMSIEEETNLFYFLKQRQNIRTQYSEDD